MGFHKGSFHILRVDGTVELKNGWIDETNAFGYHALKKVSRGGREYNWKWAATDIRSGLRMVALDTRAACSAWIANNTALICEQMAKPEYTKAIEEKERRLRDGKIYKNLAR